MSSCEGAAITAKSNNQRPFRMKLLLKVQPLAKNQRHWGYFFYWRFSLLVQSKKRCGVFVPNQTRPLDLGWLWRWETEVVSKPLKGEILLGGWTNPFETYARQNWTSSPNSNWKLNIFETTTTTKTIIHQPHFWVISGKVSLTMSKQSGCFPKIGGKPPKWMVYNGKHH